MQVHGRKSTYASTQSFISTNLPRYKQWAVLGKKKKKKDMITEAILTVGVKCQQQCPSISGNGGPNL